MTVPKRWPDHAEWAITDAIARMMRMKGMCDKLLRLPLPEAVKMAVMEVKMMAMETETDMVRVKEGR